jgi:hypothetical protein
VRPEGEASHGDADDDSRAFVDRAVFSGNGGSTLPPLTIPPNGVIVHWTAQLDQFGEKSFVVSSSNDANSVEFDNGSGATSGSSFIPAKTYTFEVTASAAWTVSF